jgi:PAS domain S-box-containing protein
MREAVLSRVVGGNQRGVLRSFFDRSGMCMAQLDSSIRLIEANADFSRQFGCLPAELDGQCFSDLLHQDVRAKVSQQFTGLLARQRPRFTEPTISFHQKDSTVFSGELTGFAVRGDGGHVDSLMALVCPEGGSRNGRPPGTRKLLLTDLDARILEGVAAGVSTVRLASNLYLSRGGIEYHVNILLRRLKVNNRPALVSKAYSIGLLCPGWPPRVNPGYMKLADSGHVRACHPALRVRPRHSAAAAPPHRNAWPRAGTASQGRQSASLRRFSHSPRADLLTSVRVLCMMMLPGPWRPIHTAAPEGRMLRWSNQKFCCSAARNTCR